MDFQLLRVRVWDAAMRAATAVTYRRDIAGRVACPPASSVLRLVALLASLPCLARSQQSMPDLLTEVVAELEAVNRVSYHAEFTLQTAQSPITAAAEIPEPIRYLAPFILQGRQPLVQARCSYAAGRFAVEAIDHRLSDEDGSPRRVLICHDGTRTFEAVFPQATAAIYEKPTNGGLLLLPWALHGMLGAIPYSALIRHAFTVDPRSVDCTGSVDCCTVTFPASLRAGSRQQLRITMVRREGSLAMAKSEFTSASGQVHTKLISRWSRAGRSWLPAAFSYVADLSGGTVPLEFRGHIVYEAHAGLDGDRVLSVLDRVSQISTTEGTFTHPNAFQIALNQAADLVAKVNAQDESPAGINGAGASATSWLLHPGGGANWPAIDGVKRDWRARAGTFHVQALAGGRSAQASLAALLAAERRTTSLSDLVHDNPGFQLSVEEIVTLSTKAGMPLRAYQVERSALLRLTRPFLLLERPSESAHHASVAVVKLGSLLIWTPPTQTRRGSACDDVAVKERAIVMVQEEDWEIMQSIAGSRPYKDGLFWLAAGLLLLGGLILVRRRQAYEIAPAANVLQLAPR